MTSLRTGTGRKHAFRGLAAGVFVACGFVFAGAALSAGSYSDAVGDNNAAPDITAVSVAETTADVVSVTVTVANFQTLPERSWLNVWFDSDSDPNTGDAAGDEVLVRYLSDGTVQLHVWDGSELVERSTAELAGSFDAGVLSLSLPKSALGVSSTFGILAVSARSQQLGNNELVASDYAPDASRSAYTGPEATEFPDPENDHDAAPDIASIQVSDAKSGWVSFAVTTPNYAVLPDESLVGVTLDADNRRTTGEGGADVRVTSIGGEFELERWLSATKRWVPDDASTRVRIRNVGGVVTLEVHRSELGGSNRLGFSVVTADINAATSSVVGFDVAPDDAPFFSYSFTNKAALKLEVMRLSSSPARPRAGKRFAVNLAVRRSDTGKGITSGKVVCRVLVAKQRVPVKGTVVRGGGRCSFVVPASAKGKTVRGSITVRSSGKSVARNFSYRVG